jgi:hypothetical protein
VTRAGALVGGIALAALLAGCPEMVPVATVKGKPTQDFPEVWGAAPGAPAAGGAAQAPSTAPAPSGCARDLDCKGDRVCERGECVAPK